MTDIDLLRRAAALMRKRAAGATDEATHWVIWPEAPGCVMDPSSGSQVAASDSADAAQHIASWHPAVALAVADWLEEQIASWIEHEPLWTRGSKAYPEAWAGRGLTVEANLQHHYKHAVSVARAYLGEAK